MDMANALSLGFSVATTPFNLMLALIGALIGTVIGILPGLGVSSTLAIILPLTFGMDPASALILMCGVYCGARYGGSTTAILMNLPGEASAVVTCLDGHQMALQGRAGAALGVAGISSFVAGTASVLGMMLFAPMLTGIALSMKPPEYFGIALLGLSLVTSLSGKSVTKGLLATALGLLLAMVGSDPMTSTSRLTFGYLELLDGISFVTVAIGLFAISDVLVNLEEQVKTQLVPVPKGLRNYFPAWADLRRCVPTWISSYVIGFIIGVLPGAGATVASFLSYTFSKSVSRTPERFGKGAVEGVAAAESADNASTGGNLVPMFTLGLPGSSGSAMMMAVLVMAGIAPGPFFIKSHPDVFWGVVASMYIGNVMLLIINLPMIPLVVNLLRIPYYLLSTVIIVACMVGVYSVDNSVFDLWMMLLFGVIGYFFKKFDYPPAALLLAMILAPMTERALRQSLVLSRGSIVDVFIKSPMAAVLVALAIIALVYPYVRTFIGRSRGNRLPQAASTGLP
jgi:putative tricarboxylic transport membrane protein